MKSGTKIAVSTLSGIAVGSIVTMLFTPKSGRQVRHDVGEVAGRGKDQFFEYINEKKSQAKTKHASRQAAVEKPAVDYPITTP